MKVSELSGAARFVSRRILLAAALGSAALLALTSQASAAPIVATCEKDPGVAPVEISLSGDSVGGESRQANLRISRVDDSLEIAFAFGAGVSPQPLACAGGPLLLSEVTSVLVNDQADYGMSGGRTLTVSEAGGPLVGGEPESDGNSEIEIYATSGGGAGSRLVVEPEADHNDHWHFGRVVGASPGESGNGVNLTDDGDVDVVAAALRVHADAGAGDDVITANGSEPYFAGPLEHGLGYFSGFFAGGAGEDSIVSGIGGPSDFGSGDELHGGSDNDTLIAIGGTLPNYGAYMDGGLADDLLVGADGDEQMEGGPDNGSDDLYADGGDDQLFGGDGGDKLVPGDGDDGISGGGGIDTLSYEDAGYGVTVDLGQTGPQNTGGALGAAGTDTVGNDIENLIGSLFRDTLRGNSLVNRIFARDGVRDRISCGDPSTTPGDEVRADGLDEVSGDCEAVDRPVLQTYLRGPRRPLYDRTPTFRFSASEPGTSFQCRRDFGRWRRCSSPVTTKRLSFGIHVFSVRAVRASGEADKTPARRIFLVRRSPRR